MASPLRNSSIASWINRTETIPYWKLNPIKIPIKSLSLILQEIYWEPWSFKQDRTDEEIPC